METKRVSRNIAIGVAALLLLGGLLLWRAKSKVNQVALSSAPQPVGAIAARAETYRPARTYVGRIDPWISANVGPQFLSAYLDTVLVRPGASVKQGQVLATLDCRNANAGARAVEMQARALDEQQRQLTHESSRVTAMLDGGFVSPNEAEIKSSESAAKMSELLAEKARLAGTSLEVGDCILRAPFSGEVATRSMDPGGFARPGNTIVTVVDRATVRMTADVPENDFDDVAPGKQVMVHVYATKKDLPGAITRRAPAADASTRTVHVEVDLADPARQIPVGTTGELRVDLGTPIQAVALPLSSATIRDTKATIFIVSQGTAHARSFTLLGEGGGTLYAKPSDVAPGTWVVSEGRGLIKEGSKVDAKLEQAAQGPGDDAGPSETAALPAAAPEGDAMTGLSLRNPIAILMLCIGVIVFAGVVTPRMSVDTFPELTPPVLIIGTLCPGLGPRDVEKTVSWRLEKYVSATPGVEHVESLSRNNFSVIYVWLKWGTDLNAAQTLVQSQAGFAMAAVPKSLGVLPPFVLQYDPSNAPVIQVVVSGEGYTGPQLYDYAFNSVEPLLEGISGVASAAPDGGRMRQINVVVDPARAQARNVTADDVAQAVARSNALLPAGEFIAPKFDANVYTNAIPRRVKDLGDAPVKVEGDKAVLIRDVARVDDGGTPLTQSVSVNGREAVYLNVLRVPGGNTIEIVDAVKKVVEGLHDLPAGVKVQAFFDQSGFVRTTYHGLKKEIVQALILIGLVILIFLQSLRGTLIVSVAIPLSFAITLIVLYASGETLNAFTLGGLTLAMGRLVDDAVVVLESIHRHQRLGLSAKQAALEGTNAVALPVFASTLTTMAVLLPVLLLAGLAKKLFAPLALTVAVAMIASYFVSMCVTPVACRYFLGHDEPGRLGKKLQGFIDGTAARYADVLRAVLPFRAAILIASAVLVLASGWAASQLPSTFFPEIDESMDQIYVRFSPGLSIAQASEKISAMAQALQRELPAGSIKMIIANVGMPGNARALLVSPNLGPDTGFLRIAFSEAEERKASQGELAIQARQILAKDFPGVETLQAPGGLVASVFANGYTAPIAVEVRGENLEELQQEARAIADVARTIPGIRDVRTSLQLDYPEVHVDTDREKAGFVGVGMKDAAQATLEATLGNINTPGTWIDANNGQSYYVVTFFDGAKVTDTHELAALPVRVNQDGRAILLGAYADIHRGTGPLAVERNHLERAAHVLMQTENRDLGSAGKALEKALHEDAATRNIQWQFAGQIELMRTTFSGLGLALGLAVMVVFMIMASQFKSLRLPFVMLFTIPVSLVGIVLALMAAGQGFSITALMGILMVIGIAVSNGILLVDDASTRMREVHPVPIDKLEAIVLAARSRFVPIAMTSIATVIGLIPTAMGLEHGSEANQPLALAVVGGLTSSTLLSLFLVPVMFMIFARPVHADADDAAEAHAHPLPAAPA